MMRAVALALPFALLLGACRTMEQGSGVPSPARELVPRVDYEPSWAPDGLSIAFVSNRNGPFNVYVMAVDGGSMHRITDHAGPDDTPVFSPNGRQLAFVSEVTGDPEVYVVQADGANLRRITNHAGPDLHPSWSPDGQSLLINSGPLDGSRIDVCSISLDGQKQKCFTSGGINTYASFSSDGERVLYRRSVGGDRSEVRVHEARSGRDIAITNGNSFDGWPSWSPDAGRIAFASNRSGAFEIYVMQSDGTGMVRLGGAGERSTNPRWSPDGRQLLFTAKRGRTIGMFVFDMAPTKSLNGTK